MIPFVDLRAQYREIQQEVEQAVTRVLADAAYVLGSEVEGFESEFASGLQRVDQVMNELRASGGVDIARLVLANRQIARLLT